MQKMRIASCTQTWVNSQHLGGAKNSPKPNRILQGFFTKVPLEHPCHWSALGSRVVYIWWHWLPTRGGGVAGVAVQTFRGFLLLMIPRWFSMCIFHDSQDLSSSSSFTFWVSKMNESTEFSMEIKTTKPKGFPNKIWRFIVIIATTSYTYGEVSVSTNISKAFAKSSFRSSGAASYIRVNFTWN